MNHCCEMMTSNVNNVCAQHTDRFDCPDCLIHFDPNKNRYGIIIHNGGPSYILIKFCPWCGKKL